MTELEELMKCPVNWADLIPGENWFWSLPYLDWIYSIAQHAVDSDDLPYDSDDSSAGGIDMPSSSIFFMSRLSPWVRIASTSMAPLEPRNTPGRSSAGQASSIAMRTDCLGIEPKQAPNCVACLLSRVIDM